MAKTKYVYFFGDGDAEGDESMRLILGGKGANLAQMAKAPLSLPVPSGFTISIDVCQEYYKLGRKYPSELAAEVAKNLAKLEKSMGKKLGDEKDPLLVSVRSGAAESMPGMMDTILNLGLNDKSVIGLATKTNNPRFAWDAYRRFIQMYGNVAMGVDHDKFEAIIEQVKEIRHIKEDVDLTTDELKMIVAKYKEMYKREKGKDFPQDPQEQMWGAIGAVFGSWMNERAIIYRKLNNIDENKIKGTAVTVMAMVFGNMGETSGTGVAFSRDPSTGENKFMAEYLINAQGEDVVAGIRTPMDISALEKQQPKIFAEITKIRNRLEKHYHDMQDMEFTVQEGKLYMLQCRNGKRTGAAAVKMAVDMVAEKLITKEMAIARVKPDQIDSLLHPTFNKAELAKGVKIASGLNASPGAACGQIVFTAADAEKWAKDGKKVLLVRKETSPDDIAGMVAAEGILTATGGRTSHAAVVARGMNTPCVCGCEAIKVGNGTCTIDGKEYKEGAFLSIDGSTGNVYAGQIATQPATLSKELETFLGWCDEIRNSSVRKMGKSTIKGFGVRANGDQPVDAENAFRFGAEGIGLCRTEHMFFDPAKLPYFQAMIASDSTAMREKALANILPLQKNDFVGIFKAMKGQPVIIRFLDPPLHEFTPKTREDRAKVLNVLRNQGTNIDDNALTAVFEALHEQNPMMGHRGCRLAITYPEIFKMQAEAVALAAIECQKAGVKVQPNIMIPIVGEPNELATIRAECEEVIARVQKEKGVKTSINIGTMIEIPRAAVLSDQIVQSADFYSFGTNDLTQMTFGYSRDDAAKFLDAYYSRKILADDPFKTLDKNGVGSLIKMAVEKARSVKPDFHCGICGEHGGDPESIKFCYEAGLNYVSCSPFRVPIARLAAAQAVLEAKEAAKAPAKKPAAKKPAAKKAPAKKAAAKKPVAKKAPAKKAAAKKAPAKKATAKKAVAKKAPAKKATAKKAKK
ncbi:pyruvate, phosphate dikinase [Treponema sp.]|uniref:pyruvate, phosphate dikinase n=1 Tax=Treponema sp. TaxID=166 RepID=UPI00298D893A|nr:pyruvate, phosphate dikinase [Treponema sp.]MCR5613325.1 pyruvate, phosphate dikinase [Treponema sp.]